MSEQELGARPFYHTDKAMLIEPRDLESARQALIHNDTAGTLAQFVRDQLARDLADIENAAAALRRAEPALSWTKPAVPVVPKSRPLWLLIGLLWLSTAIVTVGAACAIAVLYG